jgi:hypothetical protein
MYGRHPPSAIDHSYLRGLDNPRAPSDDATALDAISAGFDPAGYAIDHGMDHLQVRHEDPRRHSRDVLTDAARLLRLTTS